MEIRHVFNSIIPKILGVKAITLYPFIFYRLPKHEISPLLVSHEFVHVLQIRHAGVVVFYLKYLAEFLAGFLLFWSFEEAYLNISYEQEAYALQSDGEYLIYAQRVLEE